MQLKLTILLPFLLLFNFVASAHYMWVESPENGKKGKTHLVQVFYGEYTYGVIEDPKGENFAIVKNFSLWVISPSGKKEAIETTMKGETFQGTFIPSEDGTYTVVLNNSDIKVIDYSQYDFGIFKTHYYATAKVVVGKEVADSQVDNAAGLAIINTAKTKVEKGNEVSLKVLYKGEPIADQEVTIFIADLWSKKLTTDEAGEVTLKLPWETKYTVETTKKEAVPGTYKGEAYEFIWHCATHCIAL